jgi:hypothetical protein
MALNIYAMIWIMQRRMDGVNALRRILDKVARAVSGLSPSGPIDPMPWIALLTLSLLLPLLSG